MAFSVENFALTAPAGSLSAYVADLSGSVTAPAPTISASGAGVWDAALVMPVPTLRTSPDFGWRAEIEIPSTALSATILPGGLLSGDLQAPAPQLTALADRSGQATLTAPAPTISAEAYTEIVWAAALSAPAPTLDADYVIPISATFDVWAMNARTLGHSTYTNYPFTSFFRLGASYYGCASDGVYLLEGDDDAGTDIDARTTHGVSDLGTDFLKRVDSVYLNMRSAGHLQAVVTVGETEQRTYSAKTSADGMATVRAKVASGLKGRNWQIGFRSVAGAKFTISDARIEYIKLSRRVW